MEIRRFLVWSIVLLLLLLFLPHPTWGYEPRTTHAGLTQEIIKTFNRNHTGANISDADAEKIIAGAIGEDEGTRPLRHFFDPIYNRGLTLTARKTQEPDLAALSWISSKEWARNSLEQSGNSPLIGNLMPYFSADSDFTWERGIYEFTWGDKDTGLNALGHVLHLLEDASVPDHTRNDPHPPYLTSIFHQASPYEKWAGQYDRNNIEMTLLTAESPRKPEYSFADPGEYFDNLALYSNKKFFSQDTILDSAYAEPTILQETSHTLSDGQSYRFGLNADGFIIVRINKTFDLSTGEITKKYSILDRDNIVLGTYWTHLTQEDILNGSGVIKLFFDEANKEKETRTLYDKNRSWLQKQFDRLAPLTASVSDSLGKLFAENKLPDDITPAENIIPAASSLPAENNTNKLAVKPPSLTASPPATPASTTQKTILANQTAITTVSSPLPLGRFIGGGGAPPPPATTLAPPPPTVATTTEAASTSTTTQATTTPPTAPIVLYPPSGISTTSTRVLFYGTAASSTAVIAAGFSETASTTTDWQWLMTLTLPHGTSTLAFTAGNSEGLESSTTTINIFIATSTGGFIELPPDDDEITDAIPPDLTFTISNCYGDASSSPCLLIHGTTTLAWTSTSSDLGHFDIDCHVGADQCLDFPLSTRATTTLDFSGTDQTVYIFSVSAVDISGNHSAPIEKVVEINARPVVINEIAWAGTSSDHPQDEWLELFNRTDVVIDLSGWTVDATTHDSPHLVLYGMIPAHGYYLIERTDDTTTNIPADLVASFGHGLSNSGDSLTLSFASTPIDATPDCGGWCGGNTTNYATMERRDPDISSAIPENWGTNSGLIINGNGADGNPLQGTPKARNSLNYPVIENPPEPPDTPDETEITSEDTASNAENTADDTSTTSTATTTDSQP